MMTRDLSKKNKLLLEKRMPNYYNFTITYDGIGYILVGWSKDKFSMHHFFTDRFETRKECRKYIEDLLKDEE